MVTVFDSDRRVVINSDGVSGIYSGLMAIINPTVMIMIDSGRVAADNLEGVIAADSEGLVVIDLAVVQ